ncbi:S-adenosyl-L-methionine-dependent methyltransferases superfamily [Haematococcus lacustris]|uniref:S-adenosyl-L-methionine-dependent methyltransferases superfamily n=1 Tax=Haematococcus lacustris TaxID=44745 RepID=A0A699ZZF0_HAELA|nr:S-adenosyl-L-methionine-dependent methyltransferases superfamily [Haematococcus lacustris]
MAAAVPTATQHVVEFHAGVGAIGLSLMSDLIRRGPRAVPPSLRCVEINGEGEAPFLKSKQLLLQSLGCPTAPSSEAQGLEVELVEALAAADWPRRPSTTPRRILYLSCGFRSLQRDCAALLGAAGRPPSWRLVSACALLFFPGVDSIETLVVLEEVVQQQAMA